MNIRFLCSIFILFVLCQPVLAQSSNESGLLEKYLSDPSFIENLDLEKNNQEVNEKLISERQVIANSDEMNFIDLTSSQNQMIVNEESLSVRYFSALTGENLNIYGALEFKQTQNDNLFFFNTIGKDYILAPGDVIQITITGLKSSNLSYQVENDGSIALENIHPLNVDNLNLNQVSELVLDKVLLDDASAEVFVRLKNARLITVQISGNVNSPRTIAVPAYTPLSRVIAYSGGVSDSGTLRNIALSQGNSKTKFVDFYNFLQNPSSINDPLIKSGARIFVPNKGSTVAVMGFVNNPGIYELPSDKSNVTIKELLDITGTSFLPPGATLKALYFDNSGQATTRLVTEDDTIKEGEAFSVDFVETRDLNTSIISGAVLKQYEIKTNTPLSIKKVLKNGAVLTQNAYAPFALIVGKEVQAINLNKALIDENITLPVGSDLKLFTKSEYLSLVAEEPNKSINPLIAKLGEANIAEIYLNGVRIAYVPVHSNQKLYESVNDFYIPSPRTVYDLALIENYLGIEAFDLKTAIDSKSQRALSSGDRLFIFEDKFYNDILLNILSDSSMNLAVNTISETSEINDATNIEAILLQQKIENEKNEYLEALNYSKKILQKANLININLDGELFTYLPFMNDMHSSNILKILRNRLPKIVSEFVIVQNVNSDETPLIKNLNYPFEIKQDEEITFISNNTYRSIIKLYEGVIESNLLSEVKSSNAVKVYYDGKLVLLLPPNYSPSQLKLFEKFNKKSDFYKLYVGLNTTNLKNKTWNLLTFGSDEFFSKTNDLVLSSSNVVNLFSNGFIRKEFIENKGNINGVNFNINTSTQDITTQDTILSSSIENTTIALNPVKDLNNISTIEEELSNNQNQLFNSHIETMRSSLRTISGSVQFPGSYPVANKIRLSNFLSTAGFISNTAKSDIIITKAVNQEDRLVRDTPAIIKLNTANLNKTVLTGLYYLDVPLAINDAITGIIELKGEVLIPGKYSFTRSETLQDIIRRAGGLSDVAFPLGAVLQRVSVKELEKETNNILADQLEASILNLAQSSLENAGDQVKVVLGYATQLRNQATVGRMALNILEDNPSSPIFLEDGDKLTIPKRPSHITVVGSVQRSTIAAYVQGQYFNDYLQAAGGLTKVADTRQAYLLLPNGESRKLKKSTIIPVGSVIIVPPKLDRLSILGGTDIISRVLSNISNSILSIQNVD